MNIPCRFAFIFIAALSNITHADNAKNPLQYLPRELEIELALAAGPEPIRKEASVYIFGKSGYEKVRDGKNGFTCFVNRDGHQNGDRALRPTCWDPEGSATIVPVMLRVGELIAQGKSAADIKKDVDSGFDSKRFRSPQKAGIAYMLKGDVVFDEKLQQISKTLFPGHYMFYAPGVSNKDLGVDQKAINPSLPFVYDGYSGGARTAYIIVHASESTGHIH
ncbi:hypothetical protein GCM10011613_21380 [Cellvibrio zantedeschiae]|uniref:Uncharacterized protein n=1 Tax=Cellvibrio zantedeschiae TaxID=1237077 RepID=A0ABQ3B6Z1_9GAMM|nr:hypothetical protein [Cellvibrio zantedeschiae]GGY76614.1 hypothetical protein GCM10011613_21380 [Cellvibrio zantedeschiae]